VKPSRPLLIAAVVAATAFLTWAIVRTSYAALPLLPWTAAPTLALLGLGEAYTALFIRQRVRRRPGTRPIEPLVVARLAALAKASSHASAVIAGAFAGIAVHLVGMLDKPDPERDFLVSVGTFLAAVALIAGALFLEYACRVPKEPKDKRDRPGRE
jgi:Protein of unknown function (DUF3180)